ncbi:Dirigent protein [Dillenia turbinata]|uniref:Dirigent protein n=1 Tax=Dillenia turbinata TaxID=194707 RepID=A0AAN8UNQ0_9MAGN
MHDRESGDSITTVPIAGIPPVKKWFLGRFGTTFVIDDLLTETPDRSSPVVGRARGIYVNSAVAGTDIHFLFSVVFSNKEFNGSSLEIQGANEILRRFREVSVVSGTGKFRFARGYAIFDNYFVDMKALNAVLRWNFTVLHY